MRIVPSVPLLLCRCLLSVQEASDHEMLLIHRRFLIVILLGDLWAGVHGIGRPTPQLLYGVGGGGERLQTLFRGPNISLTPSLG